ncbi:phosphoribosylglycinamide formyltransferase [Sphingomicrobium astaxanthinifaciens]|uniref:phosphoribosylglycinamide formyltransferase n=1 Tax=Sphingomicrobium astaxanthinifaciens TaxID=1227949 RepID=UPI001FCC3FBD|nr:phosphoribosylglycinamide formyltransferase [Sphingomicrobium astaxanthinifaciens]MCJ7422221.1 phosphoribosylglycinamide formyltransferase [Sphingomicrobium astaxanthinifaciens]
MASDRQRLAILISGRGSNMAALLYAAQADDCPYRPVLVTGNKPRAAGLDLAEAEGVPVRRLDGRSATFWDDLDAALREAGADFVALAGFMRIIPEDFLARWAGRIANIHPSLLPRYKGTGVHEAVLAAGDTVTGASVHLVTPELDSGEILGQVEVAVLPGDTPERLADRVLIAEHQLYPRVLSAHLARFTDPAWIEAQVAARALALPETSARTSHGAPAWHVGAKSSGKLFAILSVRHHGEEAIGLLVKGAGPEEAADLVAHRPELYFRPAYYAPAGWIGVRVDRPETDWDHVAEWLRRSWRACAPAATLKRAG